jgi:hypothetical protein
MPRGALGLTDFEQRAIAGRVDLRSGLGRPVSTQCAAFWPSRCCEILVLELGIRTVVHIKCLQLWP